MLRINLLQPRDQIKWDIHVGIHIHPRSWTRYGWVDLKVFRTFSGELNSSVRKVYPWTHR